MIKTMMRFVGWATIFVTLPMIGLSIVLVTLAGLLYETAVSLLRWRHV